MARKQSTNWHKKHVPTRWGIAVLGFLLLATVVLIPVLKQQQVTESDAATSVNTSKQCISYNTSGKCLLYQSTTTTINTKSPCISYNTSGQCTYYQNTNQTTTTFVPTNKPLPGSTTNNKTTPQKQTTTTSGKNYGQSSTCKNMGGTCESTSTKTSNGKFYAGMCPGPSSWQCFVSNTAVANDPAIKYGPTGSNAPAVLICSDGKAVAVAGVLAGNTKTTLEEVCATHPNSVYTAGQFYSCSNHPTAYKNLTGKSC